MLQQTALNQTTCDAKYSTELITLQSQDKHILAINSV